MRASDPADIALGFLGVTLRVTRTHLVFSPVPQMVRGPPECPWHLSLSPRGNHPGTAPPGRHSGCPGAATHVVRVGQYKYTYYIYTINNTYYTQYRECLVVLDLIRCPLYYLLPSTVSTVILLSWLLVSYSLYTVCVFEETLNRHHKPYWCTITH